MHEYILYYIGINKSNMVCKDCNMVQDQPVIHLDLNDIDPLQHIEDRKND